MWTGEFGPTSQTAQAELIELANLVGKLAVILNQIDKVGARQDTGEARDFGVP